VEDAADLGHDAFSKAGVIEAALFAGAGGVAMDVEPGAAAGEGDGFLAGFEDDIPGVFESGLFDLLAEIGGGSFELGEVETVILGAEFAEAEGGEHEVGGGGELVLGAEILGRGEDAVEGVVGVGGFGGE
jgi:hypothetical protein